MHTQLTTKSKYVLVSQSSNGLPHMYQQGNPELAGEVRYDIPQRCLKIFDGSTWHLISPYNNAEVSLTLEADQLLDWAKRKMIEEQALEQQAKDYPAVRDLLNRIEEKQNQLKMVQSLIQDT